MRSLEERSAQDLSAGPQSPKYLLRLRNTASTSTTGIPGTHGAPGPGQQQRVIIRASSL